MNVYDQAAAFDWDVAPEVEWLWSTFGPCDDVLELFCGQARYAEPFAACGARYVGVDVNEAMLARGPRGGAGIDLVCADARTFDLGGRRFDLAWTPINSICHLITETDVLACLRRVRAHLREGGRYVVEIGFFDHDGPWPGRVSRWEAEQPEGSTIAAVWGRESCDRAARTCVERAVFAQVRDGVVVARVEQTFAMRMWTWADADRVFREAGFEVGNVWAHRSGGRREAVEWDVGVENLEGLNHLVELRGASGG